MDQPIRKGASRRGFLGAAAGTVGGAMLARTARATPPPPMQGPDLTTEPFFGPHQGGIATRPQKHVYFATFDIVTDKRGEVEGLLRQWSAAAARLTAGLPLTDEEAADQAPVDSGEAEGLGPERLTVTIGFGAGLFHKDGLDRFGLAAHRPDALIDLPKFNGDHLLPEKTGGDLCVQACADNAQVAMHAARHLARIGYGVVQMRWAQGGFGSGARPGETPRNLMGFKDGTVNPDARDGAAMARYVWVGDEGGWMRGGSYLVARPIRISLDHWDRMKLAFQEQVVGRHKASGAPLGGTREFDPKKLDATDADGNFIIQENSHVRLGASETNDGAQILRRAYAYDNGLAHIAERWPPWRQGMFMDAGLMFLAWQRDPRSGFVKIFENMAKFDMMNQFVTHIGSGLFACPPGARPGGFVGETLFNA
jgi:deferrochelatase/peroxidase EfeB